MKSFVHARISMVVFTLLLGSLSSVAKGQNWTAIGPDAIQNPSGLAAAGKVGVLVVKNTNPAVMYAAGGATGPNTETGVYKTTNGGTTWIHSEVGLTDPIVSALWLDQSNPKILLAGTGQTGIYRSTNGGASWTLCATCSRGSTAAFLQVNSGALYAATSQGVASSTDKGATWSLVGSPPYVISLGAGGGLIYAGLNDGQVCVSENWVCNAPTSNALAQSIAVNPDNAQNAFVVEWDGGYQSPTLYVTYDAGGTWAPVGNTSYCPSGPLMGQQAQVVVFDPVTGVLYVGCDGAVYQSSDDGNTWTPVPGVAWDIRQVIPEFADVSGDMAIGSDQGLYLSENGTWQSLNGGMKSSIITGLGVHGSTILAAAQDFPPISSFNGGKTWSVLGLGDFDGEDGVVLFNPGKPKYVYIYTRGVFPTLRTEEKRSRSLRGFPTSKETGI